MAIHHAEVECPEYVVEDILKYRRNLTGDEYFLVKWKDYPLCEATWEPFAHLNENCREIVAKARALCAWAKPSQRAPVPAPVPTARSPTEHKPTEQPVVVVVEEVSSADSDVAIEDPQNAARGSRVGGAGSSTGSEPSAHSRRSDRRGQRENKADEAPVRVAKRQADEMVLAPQVASKRVRLSPRAAGEDSSSNDVVCKCICNSGEKDVRVAKRQADEMVLAPQVASKRVKLSPRAAGEVSPPNDVVCKCICNLGEKDEVVPPSERGNYIFCSICGCALHPKCVADALRAEIPKNYICPPCRLERVDDFHPIVDEGLLKYGYASAASPFTLEFSAQPAAWTKQHWNVHLRAVSLRSGELGGPAWPYKVTAKMNTRPCLTIEPPKHLHVRREQCYTFTPLLQEGLNTMEMQFTPGPERPKHESEEVFCVGVLLTRPRSVSSIIARVRGRCGETIPSGRRRIERLLEQINWTEQGEEDCMVTGTFGRSLRPTCPVSFCPIEEAAIGRWCNHVQVFDLKAYVAVNQRMRSLDKRWTCPVCSLALRPDDLILDPFSQSILDEVRGDEDAEAVVFNEDCSWSVISAVKADANGKTQVALNAQPEILLD